MVRSSRVSRLSLGAGQVRVEHWVRLGHLRNPWFSWDSLRRLCSIEANYDVVAAYLDSWFPSGVNDLADVAQHYTGGRSIYYTVFLGVSLEAVCPEFRYRMLTAHVD